MLNRESRKKKRIFNLQLFLFSIFFVFHFFFFINFFYFSNKWRNDLKIEIFWNFQFDCFQYKIINENSLSCLKWKRRMYFRRPFQNNIIWKKMADIFSSIMNSSFSSWSWLSTWNLLSQRLISIKIKQFKYQKNLN